MCIPTQRITGPEKEMGKDYFLSYTEEKNGGRNSCGKILGFHFALG